MLTLAKIPASVAVINRPNRPPMTLAEFAARIAARRIAARTAPAPSPALLMRDAMKAAGLDFECNDPDCFADWCLRLGVMVVGDRFYMRSLVLPVVFYEASELEMLMEQAENFLDHGPDGEWEGVEEWERVSAHECLQIEAARRAMAA